MAHIELHEPWRSFLLDLDDEFTGPVELHCLGGFVISELYGLTRGTADIDVLVGSSDDREDIKALAAGPGLDPGELRDRYERELRLYLGRPDREDLTLDLWVEIISELHGR